MLLTEPFEVEVVIAAQVAAATGPSLTSLPSMFGPRTTGSPSSRGARGTTPPETATVNPTSKSKSMTPKMTIACRRFLSINPARMSEAIGNTMIETTASMLLQGVGFSNGCAELGPKKPPPLVPDCLIATSSRHRASGDRLRRHRGGRAIKGGRLRRPVGRSSVRHWQPAEWRPGSNRGRRRRPDSASGRRRSRPDACHLGGRGGSRA